MKKSELRAHFLQIRRGLSPCRRLEAEQALQERIWDRCAKGLICSYANKGDELSTLEINRRLCAEGRLVLPRVEGEALRLQLVQDLTQDLVRSKFGVLEPLAACPALSSEEVALVLVPGLAFDLANQRLGYGRGYFDRFLAETGLDSLGLGFAEQLYSGILPQDTWDVRLGDVLFV